MMRYSRNLKPLDANIKFVKTVYGGSTENIKKIQFKLSKRK